MIQALHEMFGNISQYFQDRTFLLVFIASLIYLFFFEKDLRKTLLYPSLVITLVIFNPVLHQMLYSKVLLYATWRILWLLPVLPVIMAAFCRLIQRFQCIYVRLITLLVLSGVIIAGGSNLYTTDLGRYSHFEKAPNPYKVPQYAVNIADALMELSDNPKILAPSSLVSYLRQYEGRIQQMYGRTGAEGTSLGLLTIVLSHLESDFPNYLFVHNAMKSKGFEYLVSLEGKATEEEMRQCGFIKRDSVDGYGIYELDQQADFSQSGWQLSRHTSLYDESIAYYTLANASGDHVVIDSSTPQEAYYFGMMLDQYPDGLTAWIITDPSAAQNSALQWIVENGFNVKIDQAYKHGTNSFDALLEQHSRLTRLSAGDEVSVGDLTLRVLSIDEISGFMEFELCGQKNSVRFTRDSMPEGIAVIQ